MVGINIAFQKYFLLHFLKHLNVFYILNLCKEKKQTYKKALQQI